MGSGWNRVRRRWRKVSARVGDACARLVGPPVVRWVARMHAGSRRLRELDYDHSPAALRLAQHQEVYVVARGDRYIGRCVFATGDFEFDKVVLAMGLAGLREVEVLVDVGANIGSVCIPALARGLAARTVAIEPESLNLRLLRANLALNGLEDRARVVACAVSDRVGAVRLGLNTDNRGDHRVMAATGPSDREEIEVESRLLDDVLAGHDAGRGLIWIDAQGHEGPILQGGGQTLARGWPLVIEFWPGAMGDSWPALKSALLAAPHQRFHDLKQRGTPAQPVTAAALDALHARLSAADDQTDLLFLAGS